MLGAPRRLASGEDLRKLRQGSSCSSAIRLVPPCQPGILYLEGYTDLNLLGNGPDSEPSLRDYLNRTPFWRGKQHPWRDGPEVPPREHFEALQLVKPQMTGVWLIDADGKGKVVPSSQPEQGKLNRICWFAIRN